MRLCLFLVCLDTLARSFAAQRVIEGHTAWHDVTVAPVEQTKAVHTDLQAAAKGLMDAKLSKTALQDGMREAGISKLVSALSPDVIPGADSVLDTPPDVMHLFGCGLTRIEGQEPERCSGW